jgi:hypothetical protein
MFEGWFKKSAASEPAATRAATIEITDDGLRYTLPGVSAADWLSMPFAQGEAAELGARLSQLYLDGLGLRDEHAFVLPWDAVYSVLVDAEHGRHAALLGLPPLGAQRPLLASEGSVSDPSFKVSISQWVDEFGAPLRQAPRPTGAVLTVAGQPALLAKPVWQLLQQLRTFHATPTEARTAAFNERAWAQMRRWAVESHAPMSDYLENTVIVTPDKLRLDLRRKAVGDDKVLEVLPGFEGAPAKWLEVFDRMPVQDSYSVPDGKRMTKVVLSEPVRQVLAEIKRMPGRRVAGPRAEAFVRNPFAVLGAAASEVVDAAQVEGAMADAGISAQTFVPDALRDERGKLQTVLLHIDTVGLGDAERQSYQFPDAATLARFCDRLNARIKAEHQWCGWEGYDFELEPACVDHLLQLRAWLAEWRNAALLSAADLFDLSNYSDRVSEIGVEKPYAVPFIQQRGVALDWFVENVLYGLVVKPPGATQSTLMVIEPEKLPEVRAIIEEAKAQGQADILLPGAPGAVPIADAERAVHALQAAARDVEAGRFDPAKALGDKPEQAPKRERQQLVVKSNIDIVDHAENRANLLSVPAGAVARLPRSLRPSTSLKPHQLEGVAMLQHLWSYSPGECRGCLLADDMGLGKTLQLLTFAARCLELDPNLPPVLVVAPVTLLENWKGEVGKFFEPGSIPVLTLYGSTLQQLRLRSDEIDPALAQHGITKLLRKGWVGPARVVLTTYETLRDLEFTLAAQDWSIMVCDEAQKIKNPNAMVTRAAKKQKVRFRVACTGTPVENTLLDLWCLFDFIQPGLLGALNQFRRVYKQPIEAKTEEQRAKVAELRRLIEPQTLRRMKIDVARDTLPRKLEDDACRSLPMSSQQMQQYWAALEHLKRQRETDPAAVLQTLHDIRRTCSDPHWRAPESALRMPVAQLLAESPKMQWLVQQLERLKTASDSVRGEKIIVFCEFRDLQVLLQRVIRDRFGLDVFVVNGDTSASSEVANSRQKLIDRFQQARGFNAIVLSPLAVGFGVNIQAANHVVHFTRTWNPAKEDQATDRAYRIGQDRDVTVYYPSVIGQGFDSFDTVLHKLLTWKRELAQDMLNAPGELSAADFDALQA